MDGELIVGEVWKLRRSRGFREMPHKVGSRKSPGRVDFLQTSVEGYFIPNTSPPTFEFGFRMKEVQRNSHDRNCPPSISALDGCQIFWHLAHWSRSLFKSKRSENIFSKFSLGRGSRYGAIMILSAVSCFQQSVKVSGTCGECRPAREDPQSLSHRISGSI